MPCCSYCLAALVAPPPSTPAPELAALARRYAGHGSLTRFCGADGALQCGACRLAYYCDKECGASHAASHALVCGDPAPADGEATRLDAELFAELHKAAGGPPKFPHLFLLSSPPFLAPRGAGDYDPAGVQRFGAWRSACLRATPLRDKALQDPDWLGWSADVEARVRHARAAGLGAQAPRQPPATAAQRAAVVAGLRRVWLKGDEARTDGFESAGAKA